MKKLIVVSLILSTSSLYGGDIYEDYIKLDQGFNQKFIRNISESRAAEAKRIGEKYKDKYLVVDGNEEFKKAVEEGQFDSDLTDASKIEKQYVYKDIKNVDIDDRDLEELEGDTLTIGSNIDGGNIVQSINIENSSIKTDRELNVGITTTSSDISDITNINNIKDSKLSGGGSKEDNKITTSKDFDN